MIYNIHDGHRCDVTRLKHRLTVGVNDRIVGIYFTVYILFHDINRIWPFQIKKLLHLLFVFDFEGMRSPHTIVRFGNYRIIDLLRKCQTVLQRIHHMITRGRDSRLCIVFLHLRFELNARDIFFLKTAGDVKICTKLRIALQPVFIVGLQPVDSSVFVSQKCYRPVDFLAVFQITYLVILIETVLQFVGQFIVWLIADAENIQTILLQFSAKLPVICWKIWRNKNKVFHKNPLFFRIHFYFCPSK